MFEWFGSCLDVTEKAETFAHYTYEKSNNKLMITDLQGVGYHLCDPEIKTQTIVEENSDKSKMIVEYLFCAGNLSTTASKNYEREQWTLYQTWTDSVIGQLYS